MSYMKWEIMKELDGDILVGDSAYGFITIDKACDGKNGRPDKYKVARLIASAPELLEKLKSLLEDYKIWAEDDGVFSPLSELMIADVEQAIAKATVTKIGG